MMKFFMSAMILVAGTASLFSPLFADGNCGVNPVVHVPSKCEPPHEVGANMPDVTCVLEDDGSCFVIGDVEAVWSNAIPGRCGNGIISENTVPRCLEDFAVTNVLIREYVVECYFDTEGCSTQLIPTGAESLVPVCNCKDLEPLH